MSDYSELKRLAEVANAVAGDVSVEMTLAGDPGPNQEEIDAVTAFMGMATPAAVLALIAESERLKTLRSITERDLAQELEVWRHGPSCWNCGDTGDVHDIVGEWRGKCYCFAAQLIDSAQERDQLKAENAGLKTGYEAYEQVVQGLKAENEALRNSLYALTQSREELIAQGRNFALDEASHVCFRTAFEKYYPPGTRYKLFTPKINKAVGDALVEAANLIAELPDGPYQRYMERQAKLAAIKESSHD